MKNKKKASLPARYLLFFLILFCIGLLTVNYFKPGFLSPVTNAVNSVLLPMQKGLNHLGTGFADTAYDYQSLEEARAENQQLKEELASLKEDIGNYQQGQTELKQLKELFELKGQYTDYEMTGARVIQKDAGNWYHSFVIDKGTEDGIQVDMNVIAGGGLVGIVTEVGKDFAKVRSIIDDDSNVSAMSLNSGDTCIVSGDLKLYSEGKLRLSYIDKNDNIWDDDKIVTSNISDKYLPNILIGYAQDIQTDSNNVTKSGYLVPVVDFDHLQTVLVIKTLKVTGEEKQS
ncbi:rod shape-determining protein MreC [Qiania dongpingensis]|uniref:Cell shape-determining protein MreC n=1 Tax=Qiania dongpingensis TaxID=2763669 RepID=A0A7G9G4U5_9FIRM|nr:rod shape-determining protein MreC [Qiania dongpingensis]QNM05827.1 rod shape-determining protein MreC [Qiania dongpingensis]